MPSQNYVLPMFVRCGSGRAALPATALARVAQPYAFSIERLGPAKLLIRILAHDRLPFEAGYGQTSKHNLERNIQKMVDLDNNLTSILIA
jgi:hypothetical protein